MEFFKTFKSQNITPGIHLIFIEEPEVHLHPQMQDVFISKLNEIAGMFAKKFNNKEPWPVQFVVTTHSSHLANRAPFESMRYFLAKQADCAEQVCFTQIKDLSVGLGGESQKDDREFLHKYMTLTRCDLLFADKAILIEGTTERLLLPKMIEKIDAENPKDPQLSSQYVSVVEVGGAYAHHFFQLLSFLELRTLIITDLDSAKKNVNNRLSKCKVSESSHTTNKCIKTWFKDDSISPTRVISKPDAEKIQGLCRLAFQVPEKDGQPCGRSLEDSFMFANPTHFDLGDRANRESDAWDQAQKLKKTDFALEFAIDKTDWYVPRYIADGLRWLGKNGNKESSKSQKTPFGSSEIKMTVQEETIDG